jgi:antitoxin component HigA of HigAB toxin-antitoxin module
MSNPINNTKNSTKNNNSHNVNRKNCQMRNDAINKIRKTVYNRTEIDRNYINTIIENHFYSFEHLEKLFPPPVETIKNSHAMRTTDRNDEKQSHTKCCNMLRNGRAEWSSHFFPPNIQKL